MILDEAEVIEALLLYIKKELGMSIRCKDLTFFLDKEGRPGARIGHKRNLLCREKSE